LTASAAIIHALARSSTPADSVKIMGEKAR
jgi:hypothetical protein